MIKQAVHDLSSSANRPGALRVIDNIECSHALGGITYCGSNRRRREVNDRTGLIGTRLDIKLMQIISYFLIKQ